MPSQSWTWRNAATSSSDNQAPTRAAESAGRCGVRQANREPRLPDRPIVEARPPERRGQPQLVEPRPAQALDDACQGQRDHRRFGRGERRGDPIVDRPQPEIGQRVVERGDATPAELAGQLRPGRVRGRLNLAEPAEDERPVGVELDEQAALVELAAGLQVLEPGSGVAEGEERRRHRPARRAPRPASTGPSVFEPSSAFVTNGTESLIQPATDANRLW